ncbi:MAG: hypothetical protein EAZ08_03490 [Cytophagales bacterium]|nr:MAG: hypothetical protein EAZ08_03490 [Cytophagales bacterium]
MENTYKLGIVDEYEGDINTLFRFFDLYYPEIEIVTIELSPDINQIIDNIISSHVDAVAIDFNLNEYAKIPFPFQGNIILDTLEKLLPDFPAMIFTNYTADSEKTSPKPDSFLVIQKKYFTPKYKDSEGLEFARKIKSKIEKYKRNLAEKQEQLIALHNKQMKVELTLPEQTELIELDEYLEKATGGKSFLPKDWKKPDTLKKINDLADTAEKLLAELKKQ